MRKTIRLGVGLIAAFAALAFAAQAFASYAPKLYVQMGSAGTTIHLAISPNDDPTAHLVFYAPAGTAANLTAAAGSTIGTLDAKATAAALGGATLPLTGTVQVRAPGGTYLSSGQQVPIANAAMACTGTATHAAFWVLALTAAGQTLEVPIFVDPTSGPVAAAASYTLTLCLPPSDIPENLGGAAFGAKVFDANFTVKNVFSPTTAGPNLWRLLGTPYTPGKGTPNAPATVESQSYVEMGSVGLATPTKKLTKTAATVTVKGAVKITGLPDTKAAVALVKGGTATKVAVFAHAIVGAGGSFTSHFTVRRGKKAQAVFVGAAVAAPGRDLDASMCHATFGVPCIGATAGGFTAISSIRGVIIPKIL
jgi:hypothetical protein